MKKSKFSFCNAIKEYREYKKQLDSTGGSSLKVNIIYWSRQSEGISKYIVTTGHSDDFITKHLKAEIIL